MNTIPDNYPKQARSWRICKALAKALQADGRLADYLVTDNDDEPIIFWHESQSARLRMQGQKAMAFITMLPPTLSPRDNEPQGYTKAINLNLSMLIAGSELHGELALDYINRLAEAVLSVALNECEDNSLPLLTLASIDNTDMSALQDMQNWTACTITLSTSYHQN